MINPRILKLVVIGYVVKTAAVGAAWLLVPDFPERAMDKARQAWNWASGAPVDSSTSAPEGSAPVTTP